MTPNQKLLLAVGLLLTAFFLLEWGWILWAVAIALVIYFHKPILSAIVWAWDYARDHLFTKKKETDK